MMSNEEKETLKAKIKEMMSAFCVENAKPFTAEEDVANMGETIRFELSTFLVRLSLAEDGMNDEEMSLFSDIFGFTVNQQILAAFVNMQDADKIEAVPMGILMLEKMDKLGAVDKDSSNTKTLLDIYKAVGSMFLELSGKGEEAKQVYEKTIHVIENYLGV